MLRCGGRRPTEPAAGRRLLLPAHHPRRLRQRHVGGARRIVRAGADRRAVHRRGRRGPASPTTPSTAWPARCGPTDAGRAQRVAGRLRHGTIWINDYHPYVPQAEWGGFKQSGNGRELGPTGLDEYREIKHIWHNIDPRPQGWFASSDQRPAGGRHRRRRRRGRARRRADRAGLDRRHRGRPGRPAGARAARRSHAPGPGVPGQPVEDDDRARPLHRREARRARRPTANRASCRSAGWRWPPRPSGSRELHRRHGWLTAWGVEARAARRRRDACARYPLLDPATGPRRAVRPRPTAWPRRCARSTPSSRRAAAARRHVLARHEVLDISVEDGRVRGGRHRPGRAPRRHRGVLRRHLGPARSRPWSA